MSARYASGRYETSLAAVSRSWYLAGPAAPLPNPPQNSVLELSFAVAPVEERLEEDRRLGVLLRSSESPKCSTCQPGPSGDRLEDVRADLGQRRGRAGEVLEGVRQVRVVGAVVERVAGLWRNAGSRACPLRPGDQVDDLGGSAAITYARGDFCGRSSRSIRMFGSSSMLKPRRRSEADLQRSFV